MKCNFFPKGNIFLKHSHLFKTIDITFRYKLADKRVKTELRYPPECCPKLITSSENQSPRIYRTRVGFVYSKSFFSSSPFSPQPLQHFRSRMQLGHKSLPHLIGRVHTECIPGEKTFPLTPWNLTWESLDNVQKACRASSVPEYANVFFFGEVGRDVPFSSNSEKTNFSATSKQQKNEQKET